MPNAPVPAAANGLPSRRRMLLALGAASVASVPVMASTISREPTPNLDAMLRLEREFEAVSAQQNAAIDQFKPLYDLTIATGADARENGLAKLMADIDMLGKQRRDLMVAIDDVPVANLQELIAKARTAQAIGPGWIHESITRDFLRIMGETVGGVNA